jgi:hypothetical protein
VGAVASAAASKQGGGGAGGGGGGKSSVTAKAVKATPQGKASGAAAKAAGAGGAAGGAGKKKTGSKLGKVGAHGRKWLLAEFVVCVLLLGLGAMTGKGSDDDEQQTGSRLAIKGSAVAGVFLVLGLLSSGGKGAEKAAGALGLVVTLAYAFNEKETFTTISDWAKNQGLSS